MKESNCFEILSVKILNNDTSIDSDFEFEIFYEIKHILKESKFFFYYRDWKVCFNSKGFKIKFVYVISPIDDKKDQELEIIELPGEKIGRFKVKVSIPPPNFNNVCVDEIIGVTILLLIIKFESVEKLRIGYYVSNNCFIENFDQINTSRRRIFENTKRKILTDQPRITRFIGSNDIKK